MNHPASLDGWILPTADGLPAWQYNLLKLSSQIVETSTFWVFWLTSLVGGSFGYQITGSCPCQPALRSVMYFCLEMFSLFLFFIFKCQGGRKPVLSRLPMGFWKWWLWQNNLRFRNVIRKLEVAIYFRLMAESLFDISMMPIYIIFVLWKIRASSFHNAWTFYLEAMSHAAW